MNAQQMRWVWIGGLAAGTAALLYVGVKAEQNAANAALNPTLPAGNTLVLAPGAQSLRASTGQQISVTLPTGASWTDNSANVAPAQQAGLSNLTLNNSGNAADSFVFSGTVASSSLTLNWTDSTGAAQTSTITVTS